MKIVLFFSDRKLQVILTALLFILLTHSTAKSEEPLFLAHSLPDGFKLKEPVSFYNPGDLYEYINGQAVFYLSYGFKKLEHGHYEKGNASFYIDIYKLGSDLSAFGAYHQQKEIDAADLGIGSEGAIIDYLTVFYKGNYYVEIIPINNTGDTFEDMKILAGNIEKKIPGNAGIPPLVKLFPKEGLITGSERYTGENLLSYSFLGQGLSAEYKTKDEDKNAKIFIALTENESQARKIFDSYREKLKNSSPVSISLIEGIKGDELYRGTTILTVWDRYVFGCLNVKNEAESIKLLSILYHNITTHTSK